ncbi:hypothetical protein MY11210_005857 [Beauveria gryllotalpidicola]
MPVFQVSSRHDPSQVNDGTATIHSRGSRPPALVGRRVRRIPAHPPEILCQHECTCACVPRWAIENDQIPTLQAWLTNDGPKVERPILVELLETCVLRGEEAMAQLILKVDTSPPLDVSIILRRCIQNMGRAQVVTALTLGAKFNEIYPDDMIRVFLAEEGDVAQLFLDKGLNPDMHSIDAHTKRQVSLLGAACTRSDTVVLEALIKAGADTRLIGQRIDSLPWYERGVPYHNTPLGAAALMSPNLSCLEFLLHNKYVKPDVNGVDKWLLHYILLPSNIPSASPLFARKGANPDPLGSVSPPVDLVSDEPLSKPWKPNTRLDCLEMLLNHGLDPNSLCALDSGRALPMLVVAAGKGDIKAMQLLLEKGALIDIGYFVTALMHALQCARLAQNAHMHDDSSLEAAMYLVRAGADVAPGNETAATAIHTAILLERLDLVNQLLEAMQQGRRPPKYNHMDTPQYIKWMINRGYMGTATALIQALERGRPDLVQLLLDNGADVHQSDRLGRTAVMMAARQLRRHAGPQPETEKAHRARSDAQEICVKLLLHGASPDKRNDAGHNAYDYAGDEEPRFAALVEEARLRRKAAGYDGTAADGKRAQAASAVVEGDTHLDVERTQETVVEGGSSSSSSRPRKRGRTMEQLDPTAKRRRVE